MLKGNYECTSDELYMVCRLGWQLCLNHLDSFSAFNSKYNETSVKECEDVIEAAYKLPVIQSRVYRVRLIEKAETALSNWERLKRYIINAFPKTEMKKLLEAAGEEEYYKKAAGYDWNSLEALLNSGCRVIKKNEKRLKANKNMPEMFQKIFVSSTGEIKELHKKYKNSIEQEVIDTRKKMKANNAIYKSVKKMFSDAVKIFNKDEANKNHFDFNELLSFVRRSNYHVVRNPVIISSTKPVSLPNLNQKYTIPVFIR